MVSTTAPANDQSYLHLLSTIPVQPIFIIGDHRSGTTLTHSILEQTGAFNVVRSYHVINYDHVLVNHVQGTTIQAKQQISDRFAAIGLVDRKIDGVKVSPELPAEYGFILRNAGYRNRVDDASQPFFEQLCKKVQYTSEPERPLLLKNPWDVLNFMDLKRRFPQARFIVLHRKPINVINSQLKAIRALYATRNDYAAVLAHWYTELFERQHLQRAALQLLFAPWHSLGFRIVLRHVQRATNYVTASLPLLAANDVMAFRYEDLCHAPRETVLSVLQFLGCEPRQQLDYASLIRERKEPLVPDVERRRGMVKQQLASYYQQYNYEA